MSELHNIPMFPTFLFAKDHDNAAVLNPKLKDAGYQLQRDDPKGASVSNRRGWQSQPDLHRRQAFAPIVSFVNDTMVEVKEFMDVADEAGFGVSACWFNINGKGSYNVRHVHGNAFFSGVYYVDVSENCGEIQFHDPNPVRDCFTVPYESLGPKNYFVRGFEAVAGRMYIFPGYLGHEVTENESDKARLSISFNIGAK